MKRKTSNILIAVLIAIIAGCGIMALGTMKGWFGGADTASTDVVSEEQVDVSDSANDVDNQKQNDENTENAAQTEETSSDSIGTCTITIQCKSVLKNMDKLDSGKAKYIPSNGVILSTSTVEFKQGETVYDILKRSCSAAGIPMSARKSSMGIYVEGINNLFEFDCGGTSGWMYSVNGSDPNHSCGVHKIKNGDKIIWHYTCGK